MSTYVLVEISPATTTSPVVTSVSQATRPSGSSWSTASSTASDTWSAILSGCPSVTDSEVNENCRAATRPGSLLDRDKAVDGGRHAGGAGEEGHAADMARHVRLRVGLLAV